MKISKNIHFFNHNTTVNKNVDKTLLGIRGRQANEFAELKLPILPGVIIDASVMQDLKDAKVYSELEKYLDIFSKDVKKAYGDEENPLLLKLVVSPNMQIANYPTLHNFGLTKTTSIGFQEKVGQEFAANEVLFLLNGILTVAYKVAELEEDSKKVNELEGGSVSISEDVLKTIANIATAEICGVNALSGTLVEGVTNMFGKKSHMKGVRIVEVGDEIELNLSIIVNYGSNIPQICESVQKAAKQAVEDMTSLSVCSVNIDVVDIIMSVGEKTEK